MIGVALFLATITGHVLAQNTFPASGDVGIGTTAPALPLQVNSTGSASYADPAGFFQPGLANGGSTSIFVGVSTGNYQSAQLTYTYNSTTPSSSFASLALQGYAFSGLNVTGLGNVGIGTTAPATTLHINTNGAAVSGYGLMLGQLGYGGNMPVALGAETSRFEIAFPSFRDVQPNQIGAKIAAIHWNNFGNGNALIQATDLAFFTGPGILGANTSSLIDTSSEKMRITAAGNVGIGTTTPGAVLEVDGNVKLTSGSGASITFADGTVQSTAYTGVTCGGDYAESIDAMGGRTEYAPGDLLVIDPKAPGRFLKSTKPYSTLVAGIYSTKPGTIGRRETTYTKTDTTAVPMAMMGIVPTKVSTENGPIETGDLLVTSSTMGYAMKGTDRSRLTGAVVGKALASLDSGTGVIEVLVTLQ